MITKEQAKKLNLGDQLRHKSLKVKGKPMVCTVIALCHAEGIPRDPNYFSVSVQCKALSAHRSWEVTNLTAANWEIVNGR